MTPLVQLSSDLLSWLPNLEQQGDFVITIEVSDGQGGITQQRYILQVLNQFDNAAPNIISDPIKFANIEQFYRYEASAVDPDGDVIFWELDQAPQGMVMNRDTGVVVWQPNDSALDNKIT